MAGVAFATKHGIGSVVQNRAAKAAAKTVQDPRFKLTNLILKGGPSSKAIAAADNNDDDDDDDEEVEEARGGRGRVRSDGWCLSSG